MTLEDFKDFWKTKDERICGYCGIPEKCIEDLSIQTKRFYSRGKTMEVDKMEPNQGYTKENIILSCYWCNNAKTDEFTLHEFKNIARGINKTWSKRLSEEVPFPEFTYLRL